MLRTYGVDVLEPTTTLRRVWVLSQRLPPGAVPDENVSGPAAWSMEAHLLATVADQLAYLTYVTARAAGAKSVKRPKPMPRPKARRSPPSPAPAAANGNARKVKWNQLGDALTGVDGMVGRG